METTTAIKSGTARSKDGAEKDRGTIVHIVPKLPPNCGGDWFTKAICGVEPRMGGNGWHETVREVTCPKCIKRLSK